MSTIVQCVIQNPNMIYSSSENANSVVHHVNALHQASIKSDTHTGNKYFAKLWSVLTDSNAAAATTATASTTSNATSTGSNALRDCYLDLVYHLINDQPAIYSPVFTGDVKLDVKCNVCNHTTHDTMSFCTIDAREQQFLTAETITHDWPCHTCKCTNATRTSKIFRLPQTLAIRVAANLACIPQTLELPSVFSNICEYELFAIACHRENQYYAIIKDEDWYVFHDDHIALLKRSTHAIKPSMLFYNIKD